MQYSKISVIVPIYNLEKCIKGCINSILLQNFSNIELILIDDGSSDESGKICDEYAKKDSRIVVIHKKNGGVSSARNAGLDVATGRYIAFIDGDDEVKPAYLEKLLNDLLGNDADLSLSLYERSDGDKRFIELTSKCNIVFNNLTEKEKHYMFYFSYYGLLYNPWVKLFKHDIIKLNNIRFDETISYGEDKIFVYQYLSTCKSISFSPDMNYLYYVSNSTSLTNKYENTYPLKWGEQLTQIEVDFYHNIKYDYEDLYYYSYAFTLEGLSHDVRKIVDDRNMSVFFKTKLIKSLFNRISVKKALEYIPNKYAWCFNGYLYDYIDNPNKLLLEKLKTMNLIKKVKYIIGVKSFR